MNSCQFIYFLLHTKRFSALLLFIVFQSFQLFSQDKADAQGREALDKSITLAASKQYDSAHHYALISQEKFKAANNLDGYYRSKIHKVQLGLRDGGLEKTFKANNLLLEEVIDQFGDSTVHEALIYKNLGEGYYKKGLLNEATAYFEKALNLFKQYDEEENADEIVFIVSNLGISYARRAYYDKAAPFFEQALAIHQTYDLKKNSRGILRTYNNLGNLNYLMGNIEKAIDMYEKSIALKKEVYKTSNHPSIAISYANVGNMLRAIGRYEEAIEYLNSSIEIVKNNKTGDQRGLSQSYGVLSEIYRLTGKMDLCKQYMDKEYEFRLVANGDQSLEMTEVYINYGLYYIEIEEPQKALDFLSKTLKIFDLKKLQFAEDVGAVDYYIGKAYMQLGRKEEALEKFEESQRVFKELGLTQDALLTDVNLGAGIMLSEIKEYELAEKYLLQAINSNVKPYWGPNDLTYEIGDYVNGALLLSTIEHLANLYKTIGLKNNDDNLLVKSLYYVEQGDALINQLQKTNTNDSDKLLFRKKVNKIYEMGILLSHKLYEKNGNSSFVEKAHYLMERNRNSLSLLELTDAQAQLSIGIPDSLKAIETELNALISYNKSQIYKLENNEAIDSIRLAHHKETLFQLNQKKRQWLKNIQHNYPDYADIKYKIDYPTIASVQAALTANQTLIEYAVGTERSYAIRMDNSTYEFVELNIDTTFMLDLQNYRQQLQDPVTTKVKDYYQVSNKLYQILIAPFATNLNTDLTIIPNERLSLIPFGALVKDMKDYANTSFKELDYLIHDYDISYLNNTIGLTTN